MQINVRLESSQTQIELKNGKSTDKKELLLVTAIQTITGMCYNCYSKLIKTIIRLHGTEKERNSTRHIHLNNVLFITTRLFTW